MSNFNKKQKCFALVFLMGFLIKYNYFLVHIFNVPSITGVILRNLFLILGGIYFVAPLAKSKKGRISLLFFLSLFTLFFLANFWYNRYFGNYLSLLDMTKSEGIGSTQVLFRHIINFSDLIFILDLCLLFFLTKEIAKQKVKEQLFWRGEKRFKIISGLGIVLLIVVQIFTTNLLLENERPTQLYNRSSAGFVNVYGIIPLYLYEFYDANYVDNSHLVEPEIPVSVLNDELDSEALIEEYSNLVVIQVESLDQKLIDYRYNEQELTPFLNQLKEQSLYGKNFYAKHVNGSFDADFSLLTSLYPINRNFAFKENDMSKFDSLAKVLSEQGYETLAFHGNDKTFFHRHQAYPELGFDKFYGREDFSSAEQVMEVEEFYLGINDYDFFKQSLDYLEEAQTPFFAYLITVTSHTPFSFYPPEQTIEAYSDLESQLVHDFFQSISFVDRSLEMFFEGLAERGLKEDTLFVIYSDHEAGIDTPEYSSGLNFEIENNLKKPEHIPLLIKHSDLEAGIIEKTATITDLGPTILDIMGIEKKPEGFIGSSLFKEEEVPLLFIHEAPQILYQDHLFVKNIGGFENVGHVEGRKIEGLKLPAQKKEQAEQIIDYLGQKMRATER